MSAILFAQVGCFYAEVERAADPSLGARPVIVGGDPRKRGQVQSATPDALACGVVEGMPVLEALECCPRARAVRTDMRRYREMSSRLRACLRAEVAGLEPMALDGAFLQLGREAAGEPEAVAARLCERVDRELGLPLRLGVAPVKFLARLAAEEAGRSGVVRVQDGEVAAFLHPMSVGRLPGVGPKTVATLAGLGIGRVGELLAVPPEKLERELGNHGLRILEFARGEDATPVRASRHPKSFSQEVTFEEPQLDLGQLESQLLALASGLEPRLRREGLQARRVALKVRYADQEVVHRSRTVARPIDRAGELHRVAVGLLERTHAGSRPVRLLGLSASGLAGDALSDAQLELFPDRS